MKADSLPHHKGKVCSVVIYPEGTELEEPSRFATVLLWTEDAI